MKRNEDFRLRNVGGQDLLLPVGGKVLDMNVLITLNATGCCIWELLSDDCSLEFLVAEVAKHFDVDEDNARADVVAFLGELEKLGLVTS